MDGNERLYETTLYVNLLRTRLKDFTRHIIEIIDRSIGFDEPEPPKWEMRWKAVTDSGEDHPIWQGLLNPVKTGPAAVGREFTRWRLEDPSGAIRILLLIDRGGDTYCSWELYDFDENSRAERMWPLPKFKIKATHYRRNILNVIMFENVDMGTPGGPLLREWIEENWGDDAKDLNKKDAPSRPPDEEAPVLRGRASDKEYKMFFDWFHRQPFSIGLTDNDLAKFSGKSLSTIQKAHAKYKEDIRNQREG